MSDPTDQLTDFADTAALIDSLDLVVTVDSAVAHLAGAMGKETWLMLSLLRDWRWPMEGEQSIWYPTMRVFRQQIRGDWDPVVQRVAAELLTRAKTG
jgi:ADP-heptose:LPS heptosyltransferase